VPLSQVASGSPRTTNLSGEALSTSPVCSQRRDRPSSSWRLRARGHGALPACSRSRVSRRGALASGAATLALRPETHALDPEIPRPPRPPLSSPDPADQRPPAHQGLQGAAPSPASGRSVPTCLRRRAAPEGPRGSAGDSHRQRAGARIGSARLHPGARPSKCRAEPAGRPLWHTPVATTCQTRGPQNDQSALGE